MMPLSAVSGKTLAESVRRTSKLIKFFVFVFKCSCLFFFFLVWLILAQNNVKFLFFFSIEKGDLKAHNQRKASKTQG